MSELLKKLVFACLACSVALAAASVPAPVAGDVNGDAAVDVRDVQALLASLLGTGGAVPNADVNGDGNIDVLDFQALVDFTRSGADTPTESPVWQCKGAPLAIVSTPRAGDAVPILAQVPPLPIPLASDCGTDQALDFDSRGFALHASRYLFQLMPNAPPA